MAIIEAGVSDIIRPQWILDCIKLNTVLPLESIYLYHGRPETLKQAKLYEDQYGDSYIRGVDTAEVSRIIKGMDTLDIGHLDLHTANELKSDLLEAGDQPILGLIFPFKLYFDRPSLAESNKLGKPARINQIVENDFEIAERYATFCGASIETSIHDPEITYIIAHPHDRTRLSALRAVTAVKPVPVRIVGIDWIEESWKAKSRLAEDRPEFIIHE